MNVTHLKHSLLFGALRTSQIAKQKAFFFLSSIPVLKVDMVLGIWG